MSKVCHLEIARAGLRERDATRAGFEYVTVTVQSGTEADCNWLEPAGILA